MRRAAIALVHHPVLDRSGATVTTAMTNLDLHDIARSARTYGLSDMFITHPIEAQRELVARIRDHWVDGSGKRRIPDRAVALELVRSVIALDDAIAALGGRAQVEVWTTAAAARGAAVTTYAEARHAANDAAETRALLLVFGTGWGLAQSVLDHADRRLEPIAPARGSGYNHLSVRAACAITLDRLFG